ncbi:MAG: hypothetical protein ACLS6G_13835 [Christensenellales bacterium]
MMLNERKSRIHRLGLGGARRILSFTLALVEAAADVIIMAAIYRRSACQPGFFSAAWKGRQGFQVL